MDWQDVALAKAGVVGSGVAVVHGILVQRHMVKPLATAAVAGKRMAGSTRRLLAVLLHFSTLSWFLGGLALVAAAIWFDQHDRFATSLVVGGLYLFGAIGNLWATRGRHPGWMAMSVALALILLGGPSA